MRRNAIPLVRTVALTLTIPGLALIPTSLQSTPRTAGEAVAAASGDPAIRPGPRSGPAAVGDGPEGSPVEPAGAAPAPPGPLDAEVHAPAPTHALDESLEPARGRPGEEDYTPGRSAFPVRVDGELVDFETMALVVLPGAEVRVTVPRATGASHRLIHRSGRARDDGAGRWLWTAPDEPGITALRVEAGDGSAVVRLNVLVAHPRSEVEGESLGGYRIGRYQEKPLRGDPVYLPPEGFVEVGRSDEDILVTPHFSLGQFLCKQPGEPRFVALSLPLLRKLEAVLEATNAAGYEAPTLHVMSGFRTPAYNRAIGNTTVYSRHLWGDAADVFVDVDGDGDMDDLDGNGRSDIRDAQVLYRIVEQVEGARVPGVEPGGLGTYRRNAAHGPFVHLDARGYRARW